MTRRLFALGWLVAVAVHCGGRVDGEPQPTPEPTPCGPAEDAIACVARCGGPMVAASCGRCPDGTIPMTSCNPVEPPPPRPPGSEVCPWSGAKEGDLCDRSAEGTSCLATPLACADGSQQTGSCTCTGGRFSCAPEIADCCPGPYHVRTSELDGSRCVWACGEGTRPDQGSLECVCEDGKVEAGADAFGRRVCK